MEQVRQGKKYIYCQRLCVLLELWFILLTLPASTISSMQICSQSDDFWPSPQLSPSHIIFHLGHCSSPSTPCGPTLLSSILQGDQSATQNWDFWSTSPGKNFIWESDRGELGAVTTSWGGPLLSPLLAQPTLLPQWDSLDLPFQWPLALPF